MNAGPEIDDLISKHVMNNYSSLYTSPKYSVDITYAWDIVHKLRGVWDIKSFPDTWEVRLAVQVGNSDRFTYGIAKTVQEAICLAALRSVGVIK